MKLLESVNKGIAATGEPDGLMMIIKSVEGSEGIVWLLRDIGGSEGICPQSRRYLSAA